MVTKGVRAQNKEQSESAHTQKHGLCEQLPVVREKMVGRGNLIERAVSPCLAIHAQSCCTSVASQNIYSQSSYLDMT